MLYPHYPICEAIPQYISGRTSYLQVCLAFHSYPQVIREVFILLRFGPPSRVTETSPCPWIDHLASGLLRATRRPLRTRFRYGYTCRLNLATQSNSLTHYAKGTRSDLALQKGAKIPSTACRQTVSGSISLPSQGFFSPFPHGTGSLSVVEVYLALGDGPPSFLQGSTCPTVLGYPFQQGLPLSYTGLSPSLARCSKRFY